MLQPNLPNLKPGDLVAGRFRIVEMVGSGGFSVVYRARQEEMNRFVALKVLKPRAATDARVVERFRREALYASHLTHPNTITLYDYGQTDDNLFYIAMEFLVGMDLSVVVQRGKPMELKRVWRVLVQCCRSLAEAHRLGLVHRDLKPENIFLVQREEGGEAVKVLDFGVSKAITTFGNAGPSTMAPLTQEGTVFGTPLYMAPEQAMAEEITPAVDVYALGHIAFEMITGRAAYWDCNNPMDVMLRQVNDPPLALPAPWNETPFSRMITRATQKNPKKRMPDAQAMLERLMRDKFIPFMDPNERPATNRSIPSMPALGRHTLAEPVQPEELYRWEMEALDEVFDDVRATKSPRLVVVRGKPGTGRSNLLRAFLRRVKNKVGGHVHVIHRQTAPQIPADAGLEADLALAAGLDLESKGFDEIKRLMGSIYGSQMPGIDLNAEQELTSGPLSTLVSMRDTFLSRLSVPFRERAERSTLIWAVENLERSDTLTVSFLDRFYRDLQAHPAPILIVITVSPDDMTRRPGMARYAERLLNVAPPYGRQLSLLAPGERKASDGVDEDSIDLATEQAVEELSVSGSYQGDGMIDVLDLARIGQDETTTPLFAQDNHLTQPIAIDHHPRLDRRPAQASPSSTPSSSPGDTFDRVLGYLAQGGDEVPHGLWRQICETFVEQRLQRSIGIIIEQAERFGIVNQTSDRIIFTKHSYAETLRDEFERFSQAPTLHGQMAEILKRYYPAPNRDQLRLIVHHMVRAGKITDSIALLRDEGQRAFRTLDFDAAREYLLRIQQLIDQTDLEGALDLDGDGVSAALDMERPRLWLRLAEIHGALHEYGAAEDAIARALREASDSDDTLQGRAHKLLGDLSANQGRYDQALGHYSSAQEEFRRSGSAKAFVAVSGEMGRCALMQGRLRLAEELLMGALENASKIRDNMLIARLKRYLGQVFTRRSRFAQAIEQLEASMSLFEQLRRDADVVLCLEELGNAAYASSKFESSRGYYTRAIAQSSTSHVSFSRSPHLGLAKALAALGNLDQAQVHLAEALATSETTQEPFDMAEVHLHLGDLFIAKSQADASRYHYERVIAIAKSIGHTRLWLDALVRLSYVSFELEDGAQTYDALTQAADMAQAIGDRDAELQVRTHIIYFQLAEHDFKVTGDTFSSLLNMGKKMQLARTPVLCWLFRADVSTARARWEEAREELRQAYMHAAQLGDYALFIHIARRDYMLQQKVGQLGDPHIGAGWALGALVPPETGTSRTALPGHR